MKEEDTKLTNIYLRIHNKKVLTMDDLAYLAKYNPVCFKMTCDNLFNKMPETKAFITPIRKHYNPELRKTRMPEIKKGKAQEPPRNSFELLANEKLQNEYVIRQVIQGLKDMENGEFKDMQSINADQVKELLGDMFMENLLSNNVVQGYFDMIPEESKSAFDVSI